MVQTCAIQDRSLTCASICRDYSINLYVCKCAARWSTAGRICLAGGLDPRPLLIRTIDQTPRYIAPLPHHGRSIPNLTPGLGNGQMVRTHNFPGVETSPATYVCVEIVQIVSNCRNHLLVVSSIIILSMMLEMSI